MTHIATIQKNTREEIRITLDDFRGNDLVNLRVWFETADGSFRPGKQGLAFRIALLPEVLTALHRADVHVNGGGAA